MKYPTGNFKTVFYKQQSIIKLTWIISIFQAISRISIRQYRLTHLTVF